MEERDQSRRDPAWNVSVDLVCGLGRAQFAGIYCELVRNGVSGPGRDVKVRSRRNFLHDEWPVTERLVRLHNAVAVIGVDEVGVAVADDMRGAVGLE